MVEIKTEDGTIIEMSVDEYIEYTHKKEMKTAIETINKEIKIIPETELYKTKGERKQKSWTLEEEQKLREMFNNHYTLEQMAKVLGRTVDGVQNKKFLLRLVSFTKNMKKPYTKGRKNKMWMESEKQLVKKLAQEGKSDKQIAKILGRTRDSIKMQRRMQGLTNKEVIKKKYKNDITGTRLREINKIAREYIDKGLDRQDAFRKAAFIYDHK